MVLNLSAFAVGIVLVTVLAMTHGAEGAALATLITELALAVGSPLLLLRRDRHLLPPLGPLAPVAAAVAVAAAAALLPGLPAVPAAAVAGLVFVGLLLAMHVVPEEVLVEVRRAARRNRENVS